jgi:anthranilate synthase/aminodeoxychorismate synthase-like glutamine amidotransferase
MLIVIDNYDSFTYNLVQYLGELGANPIVYRNDQLTVDQVKAQNPDYIVISPGPGRPEDAGISLQVIQRLHHQFPILGVCLGHQSIGQAFGAKVVYAPYLMHGKTSEINHDGKTIFKGLSQPFIATRYHSLVIDPSTIPSELEVTAKTKDDIIMAIRHKSAPLEGIQFHPEAIMTIEGKHLLKNFLDTYAKTH